MNRFSTMRRQPFISVIIRSGLAITLLVGLFIAAGLGSPAYADTTRTIDVDAIADNNRGSGCSLRDAIDVANAGGGAGEHTNGCTVSQSGSGATITYELNLPAYTYVLTGPENEDDNTSGDLDIKANVILNGQGAGSTILDGGANDRVLHLSPFGSGGHRVDLMGLTIQNGHAGSSHGGGIMAGPGLLNISNCVVSDNEGQSGSAIVISGGASVKIANSTFSRNRTGATGYGAIRTSSATTTTISGSTIDGNWAYAGGGISNNDAMTVTHSIISNNTAGSSYGGGILNGGTMYLNHSTVYSNTAADDGGGIFSSDSMTITHSTIYSNAASVDGGGVFVQFAGTRVEIINSTLSANRADKDGGGLYHNDGTSSLSHVTLTGNEADADKNGSGSGGGIYRNNGTATIKSSILAGNLDSSPNPDFRWPDCYPSVTSDRYNLVGNLGNVISPCTLAGDSIGNLTGIAANLDSLQDNGGATETHAPLPGSPVVDHIPVAQNGCGTAPLDVDQRGVARPQGEGSCDIGAHEASAELAIDKAAAPDAGVAYHGPVTYTIVLSNTGIVRGNDVALTDPLPDEVTFARWLQQPTWASVADDKITWAGTVPTDTAITFVFVVSHTGWLGDVVVNRAEYSHTTGSGSDEATFTVEPGTAVYLPLVVRSGP